MRANFLRFEIYLYHTGNQICFLGVLCFTLQKLTNFDFCPCSNKHAVKHDAMVERYAVVLEMPFWLDCSQFGSYQD